MNALPFAVCAWLLLVGIYGIIMSRNIIRLVNCLAVTQSSTYILLLVIGYRSGGSAPIFKDVSPGTRAVDPVVQALTLTDIVVGVVVSALILIVAIQAEKRTGSADPGSLRSMRG